MSELTHGQELSFEDFKQEKQLPDVKKGLKAGYKAMQKEDYKKKTKKKNNENPAV